VFGDEVGSDAFFEESGDGGAAAVAIVERPLVDVHADEAVGEVGLHAAGPLEGEADGLFAVVEGVVNGVEQDARESGEVVGKVASDGVAAEGQGEVAGGGPPDAEVFDEAQALLLVGELTLVDEEPGVGLALEHGVGDLVEGGDGPVDVVGGEAELGEAELHGEPGGGSDAGDGESFALEPGGGVGVGVSGVGDDDGAVAVAHGGAAGGEDVLFGDVGVLVDGECGDLELAALGALVEGLNVLHDVGEVEATGVDAGGVVLAGGVGEVGQGEPHEGVIGVGRVADADGDGRVVRQGSAPVAGCGGSRV
jgi:hypothetical protein